MQSLQNAPQVLFRNDPPLELQGIPGLKNSGDGKYSYITFGWLSCPSLSSKWLLIDSQVLFPRHLTPQRRYDSISHIQTFRDYFHYHIKASKVSFPSKLFTDHLVDFLQAYIHTRMRKRTADFLQSKCFTYPVSIISY